MAKIRVNITIDPELHNSSVELCRILAAKENRDLDFSKLVSELLAEKIEKERHK